MPLSSSSALRWNFYQILGRRPPADELSDDDLITAIQFEKRGDYLAIGDQGGRVVIFERDDRKIEPYPGKFLEELDSAPAQRPRFRYKSEFQSHEPEIDYFSNAEVTESIKKVNWCVAQNGLLLILSANNKTIKLWTIKERKTEKIDQVVPHGPHRFLSSENVLMSQKSFTGGQETLSSANAYHLEWTENLSREDIPPFLDIDVGDEIAGTGNTFHAKCQKVYTQDDSFNINSISNNSDGETFISADEFRINLWNLEVSNRNFNIIDMKPSNLEDANYEMITSAEFHPVHCNLLAYGSSHGLIRISDLRRAARCDRSARVLLDRSLFRLKFPFEEVAARISDVKFLADGIGGQQLISRDYINMKLWDMRMDSRPFGTFQIHEHLRPRLAELYNMDHIFDQFDCCFSRDGLSFATGSYGNRLKIFSIGNGSVEDIKLDIIGNFDSYRMPVLPRGTIRRSPIINNMRRGFDQGDGIDDDLDSNLRSKLLHVAWHPTCNLVAGAAQSRLILYHV